MKKILLNIFFLSSVNFMFGKNDVSLKEYNPNNYIDGIYLELKQVLEENSIEYTSVSLYQESRKDINIIIIPLFIYQKDSLKGIQLILDKLNPIDKVLVFQGKKLLGTIVYSHSTYLQKNPKFKWVSVNNKTQMPISWDRKGYYKSLKNVLKESYSFLFSVKGLGRCWFISKDNNCETIISYDCKKIDCNDFFQLEDWSQFEYRDQIPANKIR